MNLFTVLKDKVQNHFIGAHEIEKALINTAKHGRFSEISDLFSKKDDINLNYRNEEGLSALHCALISGKGNIAVFLIRKGADVNLQNNNTQDTPMHYAASNNHIKIIKLLIEKKQRSILETTNLIHLFIIQPRKGHLDAVKLLIENGADINAMSKKHRWTPLHMAIYDSSKSVVSCLIQNGAFVDECAINLAKQQGNNMLSFLRNKIQSSESTDEREKGIDENEKQQVRDEDAEIQFEKGKSEINVEDYSSAIKFILKAIKIKKDSKNNKGLTRYYYQIAFCYLFLKDYPNASFYFRGIIKFFEEKLKTNAGKDSISFKLQIAYLLPFTTTSFIGDEKALKYIKKVKKESKGENSQNPQFYGQLGISYYNIIKMKKAIKYLKASLSIVNEKKNDEWWTNVYQNILERACENLERGSLPTLDDPKSYEFFRDDSAGFKFAIRKIEAKSLEEDVPFV